MPEETIHDKIVNAVNGIIAVIAFKNMKSDVIETGKTLMSLGCDEMVDGGFWIWDINTGEEFYSDRFIKSLGFSGPNEFPYIAGSWQKQISSEGLKRAFDNYEKHLETGGAHPYDQKVTYLKKDGKKLNLICSGTIVKDDDGSPSIMVGTHKLLK